MANIHEGDRVYAVIGAKIVEGRALNGAVRNRKTTVTVETASGRRVDSVGSLTFGSRGEATAYAKKARLYFAKKEVDRKKRWLDWCISEAGKWDKAADTAARGLKKAEEKLKAAEKAEEKKATPRPNQPEPEEHDDDEDEGDNDDDDWERERDD